MIGYRKKMGMYAAQLPGHDGSPDWGYTRNPKSELDPAIDLSHYWMRRFAANARRCGDEVVFLDMPGKEER